MIDMQQLLTGLLLMALGSLGTAAYLFGRVLFKMNRDIDIAHQKIRQLQKELSDDGLGIEDRDSDPDETRD